MRDWAERYANDGVKFRIKKLFAASKRQFIRPTNMKRYIFPTLLCTLLLFLVGQAGAQTVSGSIHKGTAAKGRTAKGYIVLKIPQKLHVNSYNPKSEYAIPTRISLSVSGANAFGITYPPGKMRKFSFSDEPISVYEGRTVFGFKLTVPRNYKSRWITVKASIRYQACTDEVCYAPTTKVIDIRARVA